MSDEGATGDDVPAAVADWLAEVAEQRGVSEAELLGALLGSHDPGGGTGTIDEQRLAQLEAEVRELIDDVRERVVQVKRETDEKAPSNHDHRDLRTSMEQLAHEVGAVSAEVEALGDRVDDGFENYEDILTYLTETTDELQARVGRLASAVVDLRQRAGSAAREEVNRTALSHLAETANRHGVDRARCESCEEMVTIGLLVEPECPHCDASFSSLEPRRGFFRTSVLHTGSLPALESAPEAPDDDVGSPVDDPADLAELATDAPDGAPPDDWTEAGTAGPADGEEAETGGRDELDADAPADATRGAADAGREGPADGADEADTDARGTDADADGTGAPDDLRARDGDLRALDGVGPTYAERLASAGVSTLRALAGADPDDVASAVEVSTATVADWIDQAEVLAGDPRDLDGVGPAYGDRLETAGVATVHALARADPESLGAAIDVPASTVADWVERAEARTGEA